MASYLLNADEAALDYWRAAARMRRQTLAAWLRDAADAHAARPPSVSPARPVTTVAMPEQTAQAARRRRRP